jgi:hypothetical protein
MTGGMIPSTTTGEDMSWQETYTLNADGTFVKLRKVKGASGQEEGRGKYSIDTKDNEKYIILDYASDNTLIANCTIEPRERLKIVSESKVLGNDWLPCDGPSLEYEWVVETPEPK